ncbi:MAG TPA: RDD family protein [Candidatus Manganitrophaceae bacterium]|nr:RDD family protein [Candidatus Manganitrophaceae bacterium]
MAKNTPEYPAPSDRSADSFSQVGGAPPADVPSSCSQCGKHFQEEELIHYSNLLVCAACKPVFFQKLKEGAALPDTKEYAGFSIRFGAKVIDWIVMYVVNMAISFVGGFIAGTVAAVQKPAVRTTTFLTVFFVQMIATAVYTTFFVGKFSATPGKMAVGLVVITPDGGRISYARALGRHFAEFLSGMTLMIGYIIAGSDEEKRALHDRICNTRVVKKQKK